MGWHEKGHSPFENVGFEGHYHLDGDVLAQLFNKDWTEGQAMPMVAFPSGQSFEVWPTSRKEATCIVHLAGEMDLPLTGDDRESGLGLAIDIAEQCGYSVYREGEDAIEVWVPSNQDRFLIVYDNQTKRISNVVKRDWHGDYSSEERV